MAASDYLLGKDYYFQRSTVPKQGRIATGVANQRAVLAKQILQLETAEILNGGVATIGYIGTIGFNEIANQINRGIMTGVNEQVAAFAKAWKERYQRRRGLETLHRTIGENAQRTMIESYLKHFRHDVGPGAAARGHEAEWDRADESDPKWHRYSRGAMLRALEDPSNVAASYEGLNFINSVTMSNHARQWYRLNFGSGPSGSKALEGSKARKNFNIKLMGQELGTLSLSQYRPDPGFFIPSGLFVGRYFLPFNYLADSGWDEDLLHALKTKDKYTSRSTSTSRSVVVQGGRYDQVEINEETSGSYNLAAAKTIPKARMTKGVRQGAFINAGVESIARQLEVGWELVFRKWFEEAAQETPNITSPAVKAGFGQAEAQGLLDRLGDTVGRGKTTGGYWEQLRNLDF